MSKNHFSSNSEGNDQIQIPLITSSPSNLTPHQSELCQSHVTAQLSLMKELSPITANTATATATATTDSTSASCTRPLTSPISNPSVSLNSYQVPESDLIQTNSISNTINPIQNHDHNNSHLPLNHLTTTPWPFNTSANNLAHSLNLHQPTHFTFLGNHTSSNFLPYQFQIPLQPPPPPIPPNPHLNRNYQLQETDQNVNHLKRPRLKSTPDSLLFSKPSKLTRIETNSKVEQEAKVPFSNQNQSTFLRNPIPKPIQPRGFLNEFEITSSPEQHLFEVQSHHQLDESIPTSPIQSSSKSLIQNQTNAGQWKRKMTEVN
ncbi:uncharacterized protein MELLADRAFT_66150 [Melampsora larici-populina 98AG31]|uniref:Uncharacterized protein n=1 Tax=Melampsora larici-populina (strain 98AG31 / pathotype 3-4-7) TaxID=747676 RepID=F4RY29_MELLP|nr:uncharacterized protein MELLADRAFT_66150 [Melampsora larici-populina 98AG31]EGG02714.1 hypothetical protein MELLADRAFT_66150 [Melampsora larici-populina 98AG31]